MEAKRENKERVGEKKSWGAQNKKAANDAIS
jgi:hypothetical protein